MFQNSIVSWPDSRLLDMGNDHFTLCMFKKIFEAMPTKPSTVMWRGKLRLGGANISCHIIRHDIKCRSRTVYFRFIKSGAFECMTKLPGGSESVMSRIAAGAWYERVGYTHTFPPRHGFKAVISIMPFTFLQGAVFAKKSLVHFVKIFGFDGPYVDVQELR